MAKLAASNQFGIPNQTDVFAVDGNGSLRVSWVVSAGAWNGPAQIGPAGLFPSRAAVASSNQFGIPNQTDVFAVGRDGALNVAWVVSADRWNGPTRSALRAFSRRARRSRHRTSSASRIRLTCSSSTIKAR